MINAAIIDEQFRVAGLSELFSFPSLIFQYRHHDGPSGPICSITYLGVPGFIHFVTPEFVAALPNASKTEDLGVLPDIVRNVLAEGWDGPEGLLDGGAHFDAEDALIAAYDAAHPGEVDEEGETEEEDSDTEDSDAEDQAPDVDEPESGFAAMSI